MTDGALLSVANLRITYGASAVVHDFSVELSAGRCLGVIGESGAGKSQAFLALMGLLPPQANVRGVARLAAADLLGAAARPLRGRRIAMIFQDPMTALTPHLAVGDQIAEPLVAHRGMSWRAARARAAVLLARVRIDDVARRLRQFPHELSGGMRQRVMIAMALACDPALLIADEPTTALDVSVQADILSLLRELVADGMALCVVTHDMGVIATLADEVIVMRDGEIVERGAVERLLATPTHEYTRGLLAATPRIDSARAPARTVAPAESGAVPLAVRDLGVHHRLRGGMFRPPVTLAAVDGVSFDVRPGEALGIVGESGSGKSTLTRALLRLGPVASGQIVWLGNPIQDLSAAAFRPMRAGIQIVFQDPFASLDPTMRVADIVAEPLRALLPGLDAGRRAERVARMLADVGLGGDYARRRSRELSGGQCQRVAIARAMVLEPALLVCDEAVSALDVSIQAQILALLARLRREHGTSIVFVSHNLAVVRELCERVLVMYLGRVVESGATELVFAAPRHPYTRVLLESVPSLDPRLARARAQLPAEPAQEPPAAVARPSGCRFRTRCPAAAPTCANASPEPEAVGAEHEVACFRWRELVN